MLIGDTTDAFWESVHLLVPPGNLNFVYSNNNVQCSELIFKYLQASSKCAQKAALQSSFFFQVSQYNGVCLSFKLKLFFLAQEKARLMSSEMAKIILQEAFTRMNIPDSDFSIIQDMYPSISSVCSSSDYTIHENCPVACEVSQKLRLFFCDKK